MGQMTCKFSVTMRGRGWLQWTAYRKLPTEGLMVTCWMTSHDPKCQIFDRQPCNRCIQRVAYRKPSTAHLMVTRPMTSWLVMIPKICQRRPSFSTMLFQPSPPSMPSISFSFFPFLPIPYFSLVFPNTLVFNQNGLIANPAKQ